MSSPASKYLISGRWVLTGVGGPSDCFDDGAVYIEDDRIVEVGPHADLAERYRDAEPMGGSNYAVVPGLINAHHHSHGTTTIQHGISDQLLEPWILSFYGMRASDVYLNTLISCARQLASGVTSVVDVHSARVDAQTYDAQIDQALRAYEESGLRVGFATGTTTQSFLVHGKDQDEVFLNSLPQELSDKIRERFSLSARMTDDEYLDVVSQKVQKFKNHNRIDVWFAPPGPQWVSDELMQRIAERALSLDTHIQTHCNESMYEMLHGPKYYGCPTVEHLHRLGVLSPRFSIAHGVWLKPHEIELLAETGAALSHNPSSNLRLRAGIAPLNSFLQAGVTTAIGMDGTTINEDEDMWHEMRLATRLQRDPTLGNVVPDFDAAFVMATQGGAKLMGKQHQIGQLQPGYKADLLVLNLQNMTWPWVAPEVNPKELIVTQACRRDIEYVMVDGRVVFEDGHASGFDLKSAGHALAQSLDSTPYPSEGAALAAELSPHLESWYSAWHNSRLESYIHYNSAI